MFFPPSAIGTMWSIVGVRAFGLPSPFTLPAAPRIIISRSREDQACFTAAAWVGEGNSLSGIFWAFSTSGCRFVPEPIAARSATMSRPRAKRMPTKSASRRQALMACSKHARCRNCQRGFGDGRLRCDCIRSSNESRHQAWESRACGQS
jgi:hypothetical protein